MGAATCSSAPTRRARSPSAGCHTRRLPALVQRRARHDAPTPSRLVPPRRARRSTRGEAARRPGGRSIAGAAHASPWTARPLHGLPGDTLASALLGERRPAPSAAAPYCGRPRGIFVGGRRRSRTRCVAGRRRRGRAAGGGHDGRGGRRSGRADPDGRGRLLEARRATATTRATCTATCWWPAPGRRAAGRPRGRRSGARVILVDDARPSRAATCCDAAATLDGRRPRSGLARRWPVARSPRPRAAAHDAIGAYDGNACCSSSARRRPGAAPAPAGLPRRRVARARARGRARDRRARAAARVRRTTTGPGVMLAGAARTYADRYAVGPARGRSCSPPTTARYGAALDLPAPASRSRRSSTPAWPSPRRPGRPRGAVGIGCCSATAWRSARRRRRGGRRRRAARAYEGAPRRIECDLLAVSGGCDPVAHLHLQRGRRAASTRRSPRSCPTARRRHTLAGAAAAAWASTRASARAPSPARRPRATPGSRRPSRTGRRGRRRRRRRRGVLAGARRPRTLGRPHFVDPQRDATVRRPAARGRRRPALGRARQALHAPSAPAPTRAGRRGVQRAGVIAEAARPRGRQPGARRPSGRRTRRSPFATLAGRDRGALRDPVRVDARSTSGTSPTARCSRTSASGSGRATTRATARTWTPPSRASAARRASGVGDDGRLDARQDRRRRAPTRASSSTACTPTRARRSRSAAPATA